LTGQTIDKLIRAGDGDAALLYLYILKTHGQKTSSEAAIALDKSKGWVASAMAVLSRLGLVHLGDSVGVDETSDSREAVMSKPPLKSPRKPTEQEVTRELMSGSDFAIVVDETQRRLGDILTSDDLLRLYGIYNDLRLPAEVIMQLITHCISESRKTGDGRSPNIRYIEKAAYTWEREGLFTLEKAEEYLKALEARKSIQGEMKKALHIRGRELSATEKRYVDSWIDMGFDPHAIAIAYDKTVTKTGSLTWQYIDKIISNWHREGLHTVDDVMKKEEEQKRKTAGEYGKSSGRPGAQGYNQQKHGEPSKEEMDRLQRLLDSIEEDDDKNKNKDKK